MGITTAAWHWQKRTFRMAVVVGFVCLLFLAVQYLKEMKAFASVGVTYYVNNQTGSNCDNSLAGVSEDAPWCDFTRVNEMTFGPGDRILLARGSTWNQQMTINGSGSAEAWAQIGAYGTGDRPKIIRNGLYSDRGIRMNNPSFWSVQDLEVGNAGAGILVFYSTLYHEGLHFSNIFVHDIRGIHQGGRLLLATDPLRVNAETDRIWNSAGIEFTGRLTFTSEQYAIKNVRVDNLEGTNNLDSISFDWFNGAAATDGNGNNLMQDVVLNGLYLHNDNGPSEGCDEGMRMTSMRNVTVMNSILDNEAACYSKTGTAAILLGRLYNVNFVNSMFMNTPNTGSPDMVAFDYECCTESVRIRNNYIASNAGAGISYLAIHGGGDSSLNSEASGNSLVNNGHGAFRRAGKDIVPTGVIRDNLFHEPNQFIYEDGADYAGFDFSNNIGIATAGDLAYASYQYGGTQGGNGWSYQYRPQAGGWANLVYDGEVWKPSGASLPQIGRFDTKANDCSSCVAARTWTAGKDGTISIRGRALKSDISGGDGAVIGITVNDQPVWGSQTLAFNDLEGVETNIDNLHVATGDVVRFEVSAGPSGNAEHDSVSWTPAVAYTSYGKEWKFQTDGNTEGWTTEGPASVAASAGKLAATFAGSGGYLVSPDSLSVAAASYGQIILEMKNNTAATTAKLSFITDTDTSWNDVKSLRFPMKPMSGFMSYIVNMEDLPGTLTVNEWAGNIKQLRLELIGASGTLEIRQLLIGNAGIQTEQTYAPLPPGNQPYDVYDWNFEHAGDLEGWTTGNGVNATVNGGSLNLASGGDRVFLFSPALDVNTSTSRYVKLRIWNHGLASTGKLFFITNLDQVWTNSKSMSFDIQQGSDFTDYIIDMKPNLKWKGKLLQLRFDPASGGSVDMAVDSMRVSTTLPPPEYQPYYAKSWNYNIDGDLEGWRLANQVTGSNSGGTLNLTSTGNDPYIIGPTINVDAATSRYIKIRMKSSKPTTADIFFITDTSGGYDTAKRVSFQLESSTEEAFEYTVDMKANPNWIGKIVQFRLDPAQSSGAAIQIDYIRMTSSVEIMDTAAPSLTVRAVEDNMTYTPGVTPIVQASDADSGIQAFNVTIDGQPWVKGSAVTAVGIHTLVATAIDNSGNSATKTVRFGVYPSEGQPYNVKYWGFDTDGSNEGWGLSNQLTGMVAGGTFNLTSTGNDPYSIGPAVNINASTSRYIRIRLKIDKASTAELFFITDTDRAWNSQKRMSIPLDPNNRDFVEYTVDMKSHASWKGTIVQLRFDPSQTASNIQIDYIAVSSSVVPPDSLPPVTMATVSPAFPDGANGWYTHPVTLTLAATDHLSSVSSSVYSLNGGSTWQLYKGPITFDQDGLYSISYKSTDNAGNVETSRTIGFLLDGTGPDIAVSAPDARTYSDAEELTLLLTVTDNGSGVDDDKTVIVLDGQLIQQGVTVPLYSLPLGSHVVSITAFDKAGNRSDREVTFQTEASLASLKALVTRFAGNGWIDNAGIANSFLVKLNHGELSAFIYEVQAQSGQHINLAAAAYLLRDAHSIT